MFIVVPLAITVFPVLARILAELKLLTTGVGETVLLAQVVADGSAAMPIWILLSMLGFVAFMRRAVPQGPHVVTTLAARDARRIREGSDRDPCNLLGVRAWSDCAEERGVSCEIDKRGLWQPPEK